MSGEQITTVRAFVRDVNLAVKLVSLYGLSHKQSAAPLDSSWKQLRAILDAEKKLLLSASADRLMYEGRPLQAGSADRSLAQLLNSAGIGGLSFLEAVTLDEFSKVVSAIASTKPPELCAELKKQLGPKSNVRVMEFRLVSGDEPEQQASRAAASAGFSAGALLGDAPGRTGTPAEILRVLSALPQLGAAPATAAASVASAPATEEGEATAAIRWLAHLGAPPQSGQSGDGNPELAPSTAAVLRDAAASLAQTDLDSEQPALVALAEQLAIRVALDKYKRGEIPFDAVHQMLERLKREVESLHKMLSAQQDTMSQAGLVFDDPAEVLERQFWAAIPERNKLQVLRSPDAWCIPPKNISQFVGGLLASGDAATSEAILRHYCSLLRLGEAESREKVLRGVGALAELLGRVSPKLLAWAIGALGKQFEGDLPGEQRTALVEAFTSLVRQAASIQDFAAVAFAMEDLRAIEARHPEVADKIRAELKLEQHASALVSAALESADGAAEAIFLLRETPTAATEEILRRFTRCAHRSEFAPLQKLCAELGAKVVESLRKQAQAASCAEATPALGLLSSAEAPFVQNTLRGRLQSWTLHDHGAVVHHVARSGAANRGVLLSRLLDVFHPLIIPQALDEIAKSGSGEISILNDLARGKGIASHSDFLHLKVVEALGALGDRSSLPALTSVAADKSGWKHKYEKEMRIVAMQSIMMIDAATAKRLLPQCGLKEDELEPPPASISAGDWMRSRRYERITVQNVWANVRYVGGTCSVTVESLSLGGGSGTANIRLQVATEGELEISMGLRKMRASVLLYPANSYKLAYEIAEMSLEDRARLRQLLAKHSK